MTGQTIWLFSICSTSVNDWFGCFWTIGESIRYRILLTVSSWFSLSEFELFPGLVFGDTVELSDTTSKTLKTLGIFHALSASGSNVAVIQQFAKSTTRWGTRNTTLLAQLLSMLIYAACVGQAAPILRAVIARIYIEYGRYTHQQTHQILAWFAAAITLVAVRPAFLTELSFQFSVLAALGICVLMPIVSLDNLPQQGTLATTCREAFWQSAAAQFFLLPLIVLVLGDSPTSALIVNTITAPILSILTWNAFILAGFGAFYGLLQAYNLVFAQILARPIAEIIISSYRLINQAFNWIILHLQQHATLMNDVLSVWVLMGCLVILFAFHLGKTKQRMKYPPTLIYCWSRSMRTKKQL